MSFWSGLVLNIIARAFGQSIFHEHNGASI